MTSLYPSEWTEQQILEQYWIESFATKYGTIALRNAARESGESLTYSGSVEVLTKYADLGRRALEVVKTDAPDTYEQQMDAMRRMLFDENGKPKSE